MADNVHSERGDLYLSITGSAGQMQEIKVTDE